MAVGDRVRNWFTGADQRAGVDQMVSQMPMPEQAQYIGMPGTRDARISDPRREAAYVKALRAELGVKDAPDIRQSQYAALYDKADNILGAAGAGLRGRGLGGDLGASAKASIAQQELIPAAAQIEQQYANMLMQDQDRSLGMAQERGASMMGLDKANLDRQAAQRAAEWQARNQLQQSNIAERNAARRAQWEAALAAQSGQYGVSDQIVGSLIGAGGQVAGAYLSRPRTTTTTRAEKE